MVAEIGGETFICCVWLAFGNFEACLQCNLRASPRLSPLTLKPPDALLPPFRSHLVGWLQFKLASTRVMRGFAARTATVQQSTRSFRVLN